MKIKGHTTIELTNTKTGEVERYENDNMVTNALNYYFQDCGAFNGNPILDDTLRNNLVPQLLGGLLLLDTELTESADNIICPTGVKMVGNGTYNESYDGEDGVTELGSWSVTDSGWKSDGSFHAVWDFHNTQANCDTASGQQIKCACLTSASHGKVGEGNSQSKASKPENPSYRATDFSHPGTGVSVLLDWELYPGESYGCQADRIVHASRTSNSVTMIERYNMIRTAGHTEEHMSETGKVKLVTYKAPFKKIDVRYGSDGQQYMPTTETELTLNSAFVTALNHSGPIHYKKIGDTFIMVAGLTHAGYTSDIYTLAVGGTMHIQRINADNTLSYFAIPNPTNSALEIWARSIIVTATMAYFSCYSSGGSYFISLSNSADVTHLDESCNDFNYIYPNLEVAGGYGAKADFGQRKLYPDNGYRQGGNGYKYGLYLSDNPLTSLQVNPANNTDNTALYKAQNYLATINNLEAPIQKTADKTMKVTYVLTFDEE